MEVQKEGFIMLFLDLLPDNWRRITAFSIDSGLFMALVATTAEPGFLLAEKYLPGQSIIIVHAIIWAAFISANTIFEASKLKATPGKLLCGLEVNTRKGARLPFYRSLLRNFLKLALSPVLFFYLATVIPYSASTKALADPFTKVLLLSIVGLGILNMLLLSYRKLFHDLLIGSVVNDKDGFREKASVRQNESTKPYRFLNHEDAGAYGEVMLERKLLTLYAKSEIFGYGSTDNLFYKGKNFQVDSYALVPGLGILLIEAKYYSGEIYVSGHNYWDIHKRDAIEPKKNPCIQVKRTTNLFLRMLHDHDLYKWPVIPVVVMTCPSAVLRVEEHSRPDLPVLALNDLEELVFGSKRDSSIVFQEEDKVQIEAMLKRHERPYRARNYA